MSHTTLLRVADGVASESASRSRRRPGCPPTSVRSRLRQAERAADEIEALALDQRQRDQVRLDAALRRAPRSAGGRAAPRPPSAKGVWTPRTRTRRGSQRLQAATGTRGDRARSPAAPKSRALSLRASFVGALVEALAAGRGERYSMRDVGEARGLREEAQRLGRHGPDVRRVEVEGAQRRERVRVDGLGDQDASRRERRGAPPGGSGRSPRASSARRPGTPRRRRACPPGVAPSSARASPASTVEARALGRPPPTPGWIRCRSPRMPAASSSSRNSPRPQPTSSTGPGKIAEKLEVEPLAARDLRRGCRESAPRRARRRRAGSPARGDGAPAAARPGPRPDAPADFEQRQPRLLDPGAAGELVDAAARSRRAAGRASARPLDAVAARAS